MPGIVPFIPLIAAGVGLVAGNTQNKSNQAAASNAATTAQKNVTANTAAAQSNLAKWNAANPSPASTFANITAPKSVGPASVGGGTLGANGLPVPGMSPAAPGGGQPPITPQMIQALIAHLQGGATTQPVAARAPGATG